MNSRAINDHTALVREEGDMFEMGTEKDLIQVDSSDWYSKTTDMHRKLCDTTVEGFLLSAKKWGNRNLLQLYFSI